MSASTAPAASRPHLQDRILVATISVLVGAAAIAGLLLNNSSRNDAPSAINTAAATTLIAEAGLHVQVPRGWARDAATVPGFTQPLRFRNSGEDLRAAVERLPAESPTLLPAAFLQTLKSAPKPPDIVRLGSGHNAWRYRFPRQDGAQLVYYAAPTTAGIATIVCLSPTDARVPRGCQSLANAITVPGSRPLEPGSSAAFYSRLPAGVSDLDAARSKGARELSAATRSTGQAAAADGLARAHMTAGVVLAPLTDEGDGLPTATVGALTATATAYAALASAARARSPQSYADAGRAVTDANADLRRTMTKVAAAARAASRAATQAATTPVSKPAARTRPAAANAKAKGKPVASASQGMDLTIPLAALLCVFPIFLAVRETLRVLR